MVESLIAKKTVNHSNLKALLTEFKHMLRFYLHCCAGNDGIVIIKYLGHFNK